MSTVPGCFRQMWITSDLPQFRALVLRMYWDGEETPSVEAPLGDFFALGHDAAPHTVSLPAGHGGAPARGFNSYWPMPFRRRARMTLTNEGPLDARIVAYAITLPRCGPVPDDAAYFHAQWGAA